ncbi:unnamed protein product [Adineta ricciae]|uniref:Uncharacterized protein n=1 Tax=Adineta ricciae TaxID=249248 RepID=A0A816DQE9_ADIRI|nr:unnamed protein product [Adineta ricciae]
MAVPLWQPTTIKCLLTCLRLPLQDVEQLCKLMVLKESFSILTVLHVAIRSFRLYSDHVLSERLVSSNFEDLKRMNWEMIEYLTAPDMMPVLRQMTLVTEENCRAIQLREEIPNGSRFRPQETVGVTYTRC